MKNDDDKNEKIRLQVLSLLTKGRKEEKDQATEILVKKILEENHIYTTQTDKIPEMFIYREGIYTPEGESQIHIEVRKIMKENYTEYLARQVISKIRTDTYLHPEKLFEEKYPYHIVVENGIFSLKEKKLYPFNPEQIFFSKIPVKYNPEEKCEKIEKFLSDVLPSKNDKKFFYEIAGMGLAKDYFMEKAIMFTGKGRNGKSKSLELLKNLVGAENTSSVPLSAMTVDSPFLSSMWKKYFNIAGDISSKELKDLSVFKGATGRDPIPANRKYKNTILFTNYATCLFSCNQPPRVPDHSHGFWDRWELIEFPYKFVDEKTYEEKKEIEPNLKIKDPDIINKITSKEEMSGFFNEAILGLHRILKNKDFSDYKGKSQVKTKWIRLSDSFTAFYLDCIEKDYNGQIIKSKFLSEYNDYCQKHSAVMVTPKTQKDTLIENYGVNEKYLPVGDDGQQVWCWTGIKFKEKEVEIIEVPRIEKQSEL